LHLGYFHQITAKSTIMGKHDKNRTARAANLTIGRPAAPATPAQTVIPAKPHDSTLKKSRRKKKSQSPSQGIYYPGGTDQAEKELEAVVRKRRMDEDENLLAGPDDMDTEDMEEHSRKKASRNKPGDSITVLEGRIDEDELRRGNASYTIIIFLFS
jgi:hypothetical protein